MTLVSACQAATLDSVNPTAQIAATQTVPAVTSGKLTNTETPTPKPAKLETEEPPRMLPEDWMEWPVVPEVTNTAREIFQQGLAMGNNPRAFSKVGDCQNLHEYFLKKFDFLELYRFEYDIEPYLDTIGNFQGYFDRDGFSTKYGFTAASPLTQLEADPKYCLTEETPLECELRITRPSFVLISLEFPFNGRSADLYEKYIRKIIEYTISRGSVPILATKADNVEQDHSINLTIAKLAYEYDLPLWNWWAAAQPLWNHGIDSYRNDFHISQQAWEERSKTFLMVLDHLWKGLKDSA